MEFFETYYHANFIRNVLLDSMSYIRNLNSWAEDAEFETFVEPFPKYSRFHSFARFTVQDLVFEDLQDVSLRLEEGIRVKRLWLNRALDHHKIPHDDFASYRKERGISDDDVDEDTLNDYYNEMLLSGPMDELLEHLADELFTLLFADRSLMGLFNAYAAGWVQNLYIGEAPEELAKHMKRDGVLKRCHIPEWVRRAVFHRDKGCCTECLRDLTGIISLDSEKNFDHIVPLAQGGMNDVTNIQLLCNVCNGKKGGSQRPPSKQYQRWYSID